MKTWPGGFKNTTHEPHARSQAEPRQTAGTARGCGHFITPDGKSRGGYQVDAGEKNVYEEEGGRSRSPGHLFIS